MAEAQPGEMDRTFVIADLSGYTALTESHGGMEAAKVVSRFVELAEAALVPGTRIVERVGDEILIVADAPIAGAHTAIACRTRSTPSRCSRWFEPASTPARSTRTAADTSAQR